MGTTTTPDVETLIVGAGFSGIGAGILLDRAGLGDYLIVEAGDDVGGTWHWNTYPGIGVDIPSFSYQFSFEQNPGWTRTYARGRELKTYAAHCVDKYGLRSRIRLSSTVVGATFDGDRDQWRVELDSGEHVTARYLVNGSGPLNVPKLPDIDGVETFGGVTMHTARWDHSQDLSGKKVAIIGTGASAVQVIPEIAPIVGELTVFQRTPIWCFPKFDVPLPPAAQWAARLPGGQTAQRLLSQAYVELTFPVTAQYASYFPFGRLTERLGRNYLRKQVQDPAVRDQLTPRYAVGCKRPGFHNTYLSTYNRDNVTLVTDRIDRITDSGVATTGGHHDADVLILATGFKVMDVDAVPFTVTNADGDTLSAFWEHRRMQAYEGVSIPGFPNFFTVMGPYGYVGSSYFALIEAQVHHIIRCLDGARRRAATRVEVTAAANDRYFAEMMRKRHTQIFWQDSCRLANSYYFDSNGDVPLRRATTLEAAWRSRRFPLEDYRFSAAT